MITGVYVVFRFQSKPLIGIDGHKLFKGFALYGFFRVDAVYGGDVQQRQESFAFLAGAGLTGHKVACAQAKAAYLGDGNVDIMVAGQVVFAAEEAVAVGEHLKYAFAVAAFAPLKEAGHGRIAGAIFFIVVALRPVGTAVGFFVLLLKGLIALLRIVSIVGLIALLIVGLIAGLAIVTVVSLIALLIICLISCLGIITVVILIAVLVIVVILPLLITLLLIGLAVVVLLVSHGAVLSLI